MPTGHLSSLSFKSFHLLNGYENTCLTAFLRGWNEKNMESAETIENKINFAYPVVGTLLDGRLTEMSKTCSLPTENSNVARIHTHTHKNIAIMCAN